MPVITALKPSRKSNNLVVVYVDGQFLLKAPIDLALKHHLKVGLELSPKILRTLKSQTDSHYFFERAVNFISYRPRSSSEVTFFLKQKLAQTPKRITKILTKLQELGLQNDDTFADWLINSRKNQGKSLMFIKRELAQKGLDKSLISQKLEQQSAILPPQRKVLSYYNKYLKKDPRTALLKTARYFASKGFSSSELKTIIDSIKNDGESIESAD
jgi:regulatory protein